MNYNAFFAGALETLKDEGNYREFAELERHKGAFPHATCHNGPGEVTIWCSNDYLGPHGCGGRRDAQHLWHDP